METVRLLRMYAGLPLGLSTISFCCRSLKNGGETVDTADEILALQIVTISKTLNQRSSGHGYLVFTVASQEIEAYAFSFTLRFVLLWHDSHCWRRLCYSNFSFGLGNPAIRLAEHNNPNGLA
jgi:hypothetical protein